MRHLSFSFIAILFVFFPFFFVHASTVSFSELPLVLSSDAPFSVNVVLDTEGENLNAIEGTIVFPDTLLAVSHIYSGESVVTNWVVSPHREGSSIVFSGVMVGGFKEVIEPVSGKRGPGTLFQIVFTPRTEGGGVLAFDDVHAYRNDGTGSETQLTSESLPLVFTKEGTIGSVLPEDTTPPEPFTPIISRNTVLYDGKYFLVFEANDVGAGIAFYEVKEGGGAWVRAESPYLLSDQALTKSIHVKAVDNAGNARVATLRTKSLFTVLPFLIGIGILLLFFFLKKRGAHKVFFHRKEEETGL